MGWLWREIRGFILWTHQRGSLRYDIMCALILAFIFFTPRSVFHDTPPPNVEAVAAGEYRVDAQALVPNGADLDTTLARVLRDQAGHEVRIVRKEPVRDAGGALLAYKVWVAE